MSPAAAFEQVKRTRPQLIPNRLMIRQLDQILGLDDELINIVAQHYRSLGAAANPLLKDDSRWNEAQAVLARRDVEALLSTGWQSRSKVP